MNSDLPPSNNYEIVFRARDAALANQDIIWSSEVSRTMDASGALEEVRKVSETLAEMPEINLFVTGG